jgi:hypothetical protein
MPEAMTPRARWKAALRLQPVDRLPFWPKIMGAYPRAQAEPFRSMTPEAIQNWIGSDRHEGVGTCVQEVRRRTSSDVHKDAGTLRVVHHTPHGDVEAVHIFDQGSQSWHPVRFPIQGPEDIRRMTAFFEDASVEPDPVALAKARDRAGQLGEAAVHTGNIGTTPLMIWLQDLAGIELGHELLVTHEEEVEALFEAMARLLVRKAELLADQLPADALYLTENTSTTLISPDQYRRHVMPLIARVAGFTRAADRPLILHMCGHLKALLPDLARVPAQAFEAFTSPTVGNTTFLDGRSHCPNTCLIGGTNASLWMRDADAIIAQIRHDLDELPHHRGIVVTSAGVMPPTCPPETIRQVFEWVRKYPARMG